MNVINVNFLTSHEKNAFDKRVKSGIIPYHEALMRNDIDSKILKSAQVKMLRNHLINKLDQ